MKDNAVEFLNAINGNPEIRKYMEGYVLPEGASKEDALVAVAARFGFDLTKGELEEAVCSRQEELKAASSEAEAAICELQPDELDQVAGGDSAMDALEVRPKKRRSECEETFEIAENCWWNDACDNVKNIYPANVCKNFYYVL